MERYTNFSEIAAEEPDGVEGGSVTFARYEDRPPRESISNDQEGLPCNCEEVC